MSRSYLAEFVGKLLLNAFALILIFSVLIIATQGYDRRFLITLKGCLLYGALYMFVIAMVAGWSPFTGSSTKRTENTYVISRAYLDMAWESTGKLRKREYAFVFAHGFSIAALLFFLAIFLPE